MAVSRADAAFYIGRPAGDYISLPPVQPVCLTRAGSLAPVCNVCLQCCPPARLRSPLLDTFRSALADRRCAFLTVRCFQSCPPRQRRRPASPAFIPRRRPLSRGQAAPRTSPGRARHLAVPAETRFCLSPSRPTVPPNRHDCNHPAGGLHPPLAPSLPRLPLPFPFLPFAVPCRRACPADPVATVSGAGSRKGSPSRLGRQPLDFSVRSVDALPGARF